jgi:hypothetical protein
MNGMGSKCLRAFPAVSFLLIIVTGALWFSLVNTARGEALKTYVGTEACKGCHDKQYTNFITYSKKHISFKTIEARKKKLTDDELKTCFACHTTGYGKSGGFTSETETPALANLSCEVCHGPGSEHAKSGKPKTIKKTMTAKDCEECHNADRVAAFNYKPLLYGGAH